jgi:hypothetical protein
VVSSSSFYTIVPADPLWTQLEKKLAEQDTTFDDLGKATDWLTLLRDLGFTALQSGKLLKKIEDRHRQSSGAGFVHLSPHTLPVSL